MDESKCENCRFGFYKEGEGEMVCRKNPPTIQGNFIYACFPRVHPNDWCGGWEDDN